MDINIGSKSELITSSGVILLNTIGVAWEFLTEYQVFPLTAKLVTFSLSTIYLYWVIRGRRNKVLKHERDMQKDKNNPHKEEG